MIEARPRELEGRQGLACHDLRGDAGHRQSDHLGHEGHRAAGPGVDLKHVDLVVLDGELDVHEAHDIERAGELNRLAFQVGDDVGFERMGRQRAGRVARMHARLLDVLHDAADEHVLAVGDGVHIDLNRVAEIRVEQHRALSRDDHGLGDVAGELGVVMHDLHGSTAQHVGRADDEWEAEPRGDRARFLRRARDAARGLA